MIKLFYIDTDTTWELIPSKLLIVENIADYLANKPYDSITDFQYVKNELEIGINIDISQYFSQPKTTKTYRYVMIQNTNEQPHYYYVKKATWRSKSCVRFELVLDVLNTFKEGTDYTFKSNTRIIREHKDRFTIENNARYISIIVLSLGATSGTIAVNDEIKFYTEQGILVFTGVMSEIDENLEWFKIKITSNESEESIGNTINDNIYEFFEIQKVGDSSSYIQFYMEENDFTFSYTKDYFRKIDNVYENINPLLQCGNAEGRLVKSITALDDDWYLLYRNQNDPSDSLVNPVDCFLIPHNEKKCNSGTVTDGRVRPDWVEEGKYYIFPIPTGRIYTFSNGVIVTSPDTGWRYLIVSKAGNKLNVIVLITSASHTDIEAQYDDIDYMSINEVPINLYKKDTFPYIVGNSTFSPSGTGITFDNTGDYNIIDELAKLDRTDAKNIKLIKLPYCPYDFIVSSDILQTKDDNTWEYVTVSQASGGDIHVLRLKDLNSTLKSKIDIASINSPFANLKMSSFTPSINDLRQGSNYDSKLFNSEFYQPTYVYDSFSYKIQLEKCNVNYYLSNQSLRITFLMTKTINSKFLFNFDWYYLKNAESNYAQVMPIARNNEEVLYNVPYINYIRTGYNYDIKNKNLQNASNYIGLGISGASLITSLALPSVPLKVAGVLGSLFSMAMSVKSTIQSTIQNENSIKQKQEQYRNQASSVVGSDDVDLMSAYAENRLKYLVYEPIQVMKSLINDLFFYAGYRSDRMGIPTHNNRVNFDYLECEASIQAIRSIPEDCLTELVNSFKSGVTYLHKTSRATDKWDFEQEYENWENSLLED